MNIFDFIALAGGAAFFIFGMTVMSRALQNSSGERLKNTLGKLTGSRIKGIILGAVITAALQSSSAVTVMLLGLVDSGVMELGSSLGVVMGSNIGTTSTAWLMCLSNQDGGILSKIVSCLAPVAAIAGILLLCASKEAKRQSAGTVLLGFAVMMNGMEIMQKAADPLAQRGELLTAFENPFISLITAALFTAAVQSSSASVGILQALAATGAISLSAAVPIIAGQNIGTCVTAVIASISLNKNAKRVTAWHLIFNLTGSAIFLLIFFALKAAGVSLSQPANPVSVAVIHTLFNTVTTVVLLPAINRAAGGARPTLKPNT